MSEPISRRPTISRRKDAHLDLCATADVEPDSTDALFGDVALIHDALPDLAQSDVDLRTPWFGRTLAAPFLVTGMTGGSDRAAQVNSELAEAAELSGVAFGLGSQRAMIAAPQLAASYQVRNVAPKTVVLGNLGIAEANKLGPEGCARLVESIQGDGLCLHLNVAQELTQPEGDRDFRNATSTIASIAEAMGDRLIVKETGCGISPAVALRLIGAGVRWIDISGAGGTSWVRVEALRSNPEAARLGEEFSGWGIPTAAAVSAVSRVCGDRAGVIASGGVRTGLDAAKALALGAQWVGVALPVFRAQQAGGVKGAVAELTHLKEGLSRTLLLTGCRRPAELRQRARVVTGKLSEWLRALSGPESAR